MSTAASDESKIKLYYAVYSDTGSQMRGSVVNYWNLANGNGPIKCTAVYPCEDYTSPEDVLKRGYLFKDAKCVGVVDKYLRPG